jgi:RNA polymerase sigma-70 factor (ECF subfamily)
MGRSDQPTSGDDPKYLVRLLTTHQRQLFSYIYTLVPNVNDAEDLLQETNMVIWDKFHEFTPGTDFLAWSCRIAWWRVRYARLKHARSKVFTNERVLEAVAATTAETAGEVDARREALRACLQRLGDRDRRTILSRYEPGGSVSHAARESGRTVQATYKAISRIRSALFDCITDKLASGGDNS